MASAKPFIFFAALTTAAVFSAAQQQTSEVLPPPKPGGGPVKGATYAVDPDHTFVIYEIDHYGTTTNRGRFSAKEGTVRIGPGGTGGSSIDVTIDIGSVSTGVELLDRHLKSSEFFDAARFPTGHFVSNKIAFSGNKVTAVDGTLTLMGQARPVTLKATRFNCYIAPLINRQTCGGDFEATVQRSQWGISWGNSFGFEDKVRLLVQVEAINSR
ncbi:Polyisoprenoid-binding protein YceI [Variovorax sp. HW608]|uniref:YceI family protein n=1 Tax=Variovorax sp. HW608 TaxID=1034889 RepID=UPI0008200835|nr:YceI family protein [Variovorax sp. HW608]SCK61516.1 Polyisoprenoid-binding protein YceI [Variovorax sp. HW608]